VCHDARIVVHDGVWQDEKIRENRKKKIGGGVVLSSEGRGPYCSKLLFLSPWDPRVR
jgi:hypothetical protein